MLTERVERTGIGWRDLFAVRAYRSWWIGRSVSWFGNAIAPVALAFAVLDLTGSVTALGAVVAARSLPNLALLLIGGSLADRWNRKALLLGSALVAGASQTLCAVVVIGHLASVPLLMVIAVVNGAAAALAGPAGGTLMRDLVPKEQLRDANVVSRLGQNGALLVGMALAGLIVAVLGPAAGLAIDAGTFLIAAIAYTGLPRETRQATARRPSIIEDLRSGFSYVIRSRWIGALVCVVFVLQVADAGGLMVLGPVVADATFGRTGFGIIIAIQLVGTILGAIAAGRLTEPSRLSVSFYLSGGLVLPLLAFAVCAYRPFSVLIPRLGLAVMTAGAILLGGILVELGSVWLDLSLQRSVPDGMLGKVGSYYGIASVGGIPIGELLVGPLTELGGISTAYIALSATLLFTIGIFSRGMR